MEWIIRVRTEWCEDRSRGEPTWGFKAAMQVDRSRRIEGHRWSAAYAERTIFDEFVS